MPFILFFGAFVRSGYVVNIESRRRKTLWQRITSKAFSGDGRNLDWILKRIQRHDYFTKYFLNIRVEWRAGV